MCRTRGRRIYPSTINERRVLMSLGAYPMYCPRGLSPYLVARKVTRVALGQSPDLVLLRDVLARAARKPSTPRPEPIDAASSVA